MTEPELRTLVRDVIARRAAAGSTVVSGSAPFEPRLVRQHASHAMFVLSAGADTDGRCVIEPGVMCNHCGYCKSYGH